MCVGLNYLRFFFQQILSCHSYWSRFSRSTQYMYKTKIISSCTTYVNFINTLSHLSFGIRRSTYKLVRIVFKFLYYFCIMYQPEDIPTLLYTYTHQLNFLKMSLLYKICYCLHIININCFCNWFDKLWILTWLTCLNVKFSGGSNSPKSACVVRESTAELTYSIFFGDAFSSFSLSFLII